MQEWRWFRHQVSIGQVEMAQCIQVILRLTAILFHRLFWVAGLPILICIAIIRSCCFHSHVTPIVGLNGDMAAAVRTPSPQFVM